jgi:hypothetical protein
MSFLGIKPKKPKAQTIFSWKKPKKTKPKTKKLWFWVWVFWVLFRKHIRKNIFFPSLLKIENNNNKKNH